MAVEDQPSPAPAVPVAPAADDKVPLLAVLHDLGTVLPPNDLPSPSQVPQVLGAVVKVLENAGVTVADELFPEEPAVVARPESLDQQHRQQTNSRLANLEADIASILAHLKGEGGSS